MSLPTAHDMVCGSKVLVGDHNWRKGPLWPAMLAYFFGKRETFTHLGMRCTIAWHKGHPYLIRLREVRS